MSYLEKTFKTLTEQKVYLFAIQCTSCMIALGFLTWDVVTYVKIRTLGEIDFNLYPWTYYYFHPVESNILNFIFLGFTLGLTAVFVYSLINKKTFAIIHPWLIAAHPLVVAICTLLSLLLLVLLSFNSIVRLIPILSHVPRSLFLIPVSCLPILSITFNSSRSIRIGKKLTDNGLLILSFILFFFLILEPLKTFLEPVYLINDYPDIYSKTIVKGSFLDNKEFLERLDKNDMDAAKQYLAVFDEIDAALRSAKNIDKVSSENLFKKIQEDEFGLFKKFRYRNLDPSQAYFTALIADPFSEKEWNARFRSPLNTGEVNFIDNIKRINIEDLKQFYLANHMEYWLQNMGRGQIHHVGHYLNPLNEYDLGKPLNNIFIQYGAGSTLLIKWIMDVFGGISIHNFYKTYIYYILYYILFFLMTFVLFKDRLYVCAAFSILPASFFSLGYIAYILAPGFIPTVHILDAIIFVPLLQFLQSSRLKYMGIVALLAILSIIINRQFGAAVSISLFLSLVLYVFENKQGKSKYIWSFSLCAIFIAAFAFYKLTNIGILDEIFPYFWMGWLSWPVSSTKIAFTIFYLAISYLFIFFLKNHRFHLKYILITVFFYAQGLLVYYYWSGVRNHIPTVIPFVWLQFILMLYIAEKHLLQNRRILQSRVRVVTWMALILSVILMFPSANSYYTEKSSFKANFKDHKTYTWEFDRASVISTLDPALIKESIELIEKYSGKNNPSIYILSKYDGVIPFLAKKYSAAGFFELTSFILSEKQSNAAIDGINTGTPEYLFIDSNMKEAAYDPWVKVYRSDFIDRERASRLNRYFVLKNIFMASEGAYEKIEDGSLISVYKRKQSPEALPSIDVP